MLGYVNPGYNKLGQFRSGYVRFFQPTSG